MGNTLNERFLEAVDRYGDAGAFLSKRHGKWESFSYKWAMEQAQKTAFGLRSLGCEPGDRLAILSENRPEWATTDFGAMAAGCLLVPLYTTLIPEQVEHILNDAEVKLVIVSTMAHLETIFAIRDRVPSLEKVVLFDPDDLDENEFVISLETLKRRGEGRSREQFRRLARQVEPGDPCTIVYTSGTTGEPKGVVLSHANFMAEITAVEPCIEGGVGDVALSFLPLSHILQRMVDTICLVHGFTIAYSESLETLGENIREVRPTHIVGVPRLYEKIYSRIHEAVDNGSAPKRALFSWALRVGRRFREAGVSGSAPIGLSLRHILADALVFGKIRAATGGRVKLFLSGGAPLARELVVFFDAVGIRILEVWGMTELTGGAAMNTPEEYRYGSVGKPCPGVQLKITTEGEICVRGGLVMQEYWRRPEATAETIDEDGWLHSGDVGFADEDGFLYITDRIKELIVTAGGKNVAPQPLENALKSDEFISQAMVIGDSRNFISALIVPDKEAVQAWAKANGIEGGIKALCTDEMILAHLTTRVAARMEGFSTYERVKKFALIPDEFSQKAGELTPTLKLKRRALLARYGDVIDAMYACSARF